MSLRLSDSSAALSESDDRLYRAPGKVALTQRMARGTAPSTPSIATTSARAAVQRAALAHELAAAFGFAEHPCDHADAAAVAAPVQRHGDAHTGLSDDAVATHAAAGVSGAGGVLPHLESIQRAFGPAHDLSGVRAHVGGAAADASSAIGAHAYATGNDIAFASSPDLFLAAHEATHIVQQRQGVHLKGAVGQAGDSYEQHADAVAAAVVRGEDVADLLGHGSGASSDAAVQRKGKGKGKKAESAAPVAAADDYSTLELSQDVTLWQKANIELAFALLRNANANWDVIIANTGGDPPQISDPSALREFFDGVYGNFVTDLPDVAVFGFADAAADGVANAAQKKFSKHVVGEAFEEGVHAAGVAAGVVGGAVGLVVASVMATVAEMVIDKLTGKAEREKAEKDDATAAATARGSRAMFESVEGSVAQCEQRTLGVIDQGEGFLVAGEALDAKGKRAMGRHLVSSAKAVRAKAPRAGDYTIATEVLRQWTRQHVGAWDSKSKQGKSNGDVTAESLWNRAAQDQLEVPNAGGKSSTKLDLWGKEGFDGEIERRSTAFGDRLAMSEMQLHTCLANAGISTAGAELFQVQYPDKPKDFGTSLVIADVARFEKFVGDNWGEAEVPKAGQDWQVWVVAKERVEYLDGLKGQSVLDYVDVAPIPRGKDWFPSKRFPYFPAR